MEVASVDSKTSITIDSLVNGTVIGGSVDASGNLILTTRGGGTINAGSVVPQLGSAWSSTTNYTLGQTAGYAGAIWKATGASLNKPPALYTSLWTPLTGFDYSGWIERDSYFVGDTIATSWDTSSKTGNPVVSLTTVAGEFESGSQALKVTMAAAEGQRLWQKDENLVQGGETIVVIARAKLLSAVTGATISAALQQNLASNPAPFFPGVSSVASVEGAQALTTTWTTFTFTFTTVNAKPRALSNLIVTSPGSNPATVLIDRCRTIRASVPTLAAWPVGSVYTNVVNTNPKALLGGGTWVAWGAGRVPVAVDGTTEFATVEQTGGAKLVTLSAAEIPAHRHWLYGHSWAWGQTGLTNSIYAASAIATAGNPPSNNLVTSQGYWDHTDYMVESAGNGAHNNLQPYITCYMWKRTA